MKALTYHSSKDVRVENVPDPRLAEADDIVLRVTATAICGSDLHIYRGKIPAMSRATSSATSSWASSKRPARPSRA
jgi:threonine dehydrogenase-like Zn-dependent dehydrogenase